MIDREPLDYINQPVYTARTACLRLLHRVARAYFFAGRAKIFARSPVCRRSMTRSSCSATAWPRSRIRENLSRGIKGIGGNGRSVTARRRSDRRSRDRSRTPRCDFMRNALLCKAKDDRRRIGSLAKTSFLDRQTNNTPVSHFCISRLLPAILSILSPARTRIRDRDSSSGNSHKGKNGGVYSG